MPTPEGDPERGLYGISVAAELVGMGPQNLRAYERAGLIEPERTAGGTRRYSDKDLERLRRIGELLDEGLNLAGIALVLDLEADNARLRAANRRTARRFSDEPSNRFDTGSSDEPANQSGTDSAI